MSHHDPHVQVPSSDRAKPQLETEAVTEPVPFSHHLARIGLFIVALGVYVGIYFLTQQIATNTILSYYYDGTTSQPASQAKNYAATVGYTWLMWKLANALYVLDVVPATLSWQRKLLATSIIIILLLALDICLTVLCIKYYFEGIFSLAALLFTLIVAAAVSLNQAPMRQVVIDSVVPFICYITIIAVYWFAMPLLYKTLTTSLPDYDGYIAFIYIFPIIDILLNVLESGCTYLLSVGAREFATQTNFLLMGYRLGIIMMASYTEVQFYYLIVFTMLRNIFCDYVLQVYRYNNRPVTLAGWIGIYYLSYILRFAPIIGVGTKTTVTKSYYASSITSFTPPFIGIKNPYFPSSTADSSPSQGSYNISLNGGVEWWAPLIIWAPLTFSSKYANKTKVTWRYFFYTLFGVYLFYVGWISALSISTITF